MVLPANSIVFVSIHAGFCQAKPVVSVFSGILHLVPCLYNMQLLCLLKSPGNLGALFVGSSR